MDQKLADLLDKKRRQRKPGGDVDWDDRRNGYLRAVAELYEPTGRVLDGPIDDGTVQLQRRTKNLTETYIGTYAVDDLILLIGDEQVRCSPQGRNILGAQGRVDVVGERSEATLILRDGILGFVQARQPQRRVARLDESTLADVLTLVMRD